MRTLLILAALFYFLHSSWAPSWGAPLANWALVLAALTYFGGVSKRLNIPYHRNRYYDNDYYHNDYHDQQHP
jgi:hypothetical protein